MTHAVPFIILMFCQTALRTFTAVYELDINVDISRRFVVGGNNELIQS